MTEQPCIPGLFGIRRHKFVARHERQIHPVSERSISIKGITLDGAYGYDVYVRDVCTRCGLTIERTDKKCTTT